MRKIASIRSPRACLMASAATLDHRASLRSSPGRRPARAARDLFGVSSGMAGSPRRSSASSRWAASMAFSPPLTATYISLSSLLIWVDRGNAAMFRDRRKHIDAQGKSWREATICCQNRAEGRNAEAVLRLNAGAARSQPSLREGSAWITRVAERSGYSGVPLAYCARSGAPKRASAKTNAAWFRFA